MTARIAGQWRSDWLVDKPKMGSDLCIVSISGVLKNGPHMMKLGAKVLLILRLSLSPYSGAHVGRGL